MKKVIIAAMAVTIVGAVQADLVDRDWSSLPQYATPVAAPADVGALSDWVVSIVNLTDVTETAQVTSPISGFYTGGYYFDAFQFNETEGDNLVARIYNAPSIGAATWYSDSAPLQMDDIEGPVGPGATDVTWDFSSSTWEAVPEPATIGLMGIAGIGMFLARRKVRS